MKTLAQDIKSGNFKSAYLICGEEEYLKLNYKNQLIKAIAGEDTMNLALYEGKNIDINEVIDNAETFPFFAKYRLIVLEQSGLFKTGGEQLAEYMDKIPETTIFLFVEQDVDKRSKMYKAVKKNGYICEINRQSEKDIEVWAAKIFDYNGKKITKADMAYFIANVGTDMEILSQEIEKLISYAYDKNVINKNDIDAVCIKQLNVRIFDMIDAISVKNQQKTLDCYYELIAEKEPPMRILFMISRQFNLILQAKDLSARGMSKEQIAGAMGVQGFIASKSISQSRNFTVSELKAGLAESISTEELIKSGRMDENIGVEMLLVKYSRKSR
ncbi:DNA polymerase III subunit delta [Eubacterium sp.]|uniref:DNA polymerase III subunit delta n=1 Tax=Eubacterium sp. TaxID=142586 RepID=UPI003522FF18